MRQNRNKIYKDVASSSCLKNLKFKNILLLEMRLSHIPYNNLTANFKINKKNTLLLAPSSHFVSLF